METMTQSGLWSSLGTHGSLMVIGWLCISSSGDARKFDFLSQIWPWMPMSIALQNDRDLNKCILRIWSKFCDHSLNGWWVMVRTYSKWGKFRLLNWPLDSTLQWGHNGRGSVSNHQHFHCLLNCRFRRRSKKISQLRVTGLCEGNSPVTGKFPAQKVSNAKNVSIWWRRHGPGR